MLKYKVGDKVQIRKDLKIGSVYGGCYVTQEMHDLGGAIVRIIEANEYSGEYRIESFGCYWTDEMFEDVGMEVQKMNKRVVIDTHENCVIAHCGDKKGVARCHPDDDFDFFVGAKLALDRLEEAEKPYAWLKKGVRYYSTSVTTEGLYVWHIYDADRLDKIYMKRGIVFKTKEEAIECAKRMLAVVKQGHKNENK